MRRSIKKRIKSDISSENIENSSNNFSRRKHRQRMENSLGELTKNVIKYIKKSGENDIQINNLVEDLNVKKRRIYDITNVLEGNLILLSISIFYHEI